MKNLLAGFIICWSINLHAQDKYNLTVGKEIDNLLLLNVEHFEKEKVTTKDLLGKWTILDFWTVGCTACVKSFPRLNELNRKFPHVQFVLITDNGRHYPNVRQVYERFRKKLNLNLPIAYDSLLFKKIGVHAVPFVVVLDPQGKVHSFPSSLELTEPNLIKLTTSTKSPFVDHLHRKQAVWRCWVDASDLGTDNKVFKSLLTPYNNEWSSGNIELDTDTTKGLYQVTKASAAKLYMVAKNWYKFISPFKNDYWPEPIVEANVSKDSFFDENLLFNYSVLIPPKLTNGRLIRQQLETDLNTYFET
ncbi:MAG: TlpA family protein disulfide reductase, partial [Sphingobacteriales bacterium]